MKHIPMSDNALLKRAKEESWITKPHSFWDDLCQFNCLLDTFLSKYKKYVSWDYVLQVRHDIPESLLDFVMTRCFKAFSTSSKAGNEITSKQTVTLLLTTQALSPVFIKKWLSTLVAKQYFNTLIRA